MPDGQDGMMGREPDIVISMKEEVINRALAASFYANQGNGLIALLSRTLQMDGPDRGLRLLDPPMAVMLGDGTAVATFGAEAWAKVLGVRLEADVSASARLRAWTAGGEAFMEIQDIDLDMISFAGRVRAPRFAVSMAEGALRGMMSRQAGGPLVRSMPMPTITMPPMAPGASELDVQITSMAVSEGLLALGASFEPGDSYLVAPSAHPSDSMVRLTGPFLERLLDEAWEGAPHVAEVKRRFDVPDPRSLLDVFKGAVDVLLARGLSRERIRVDRSWVEADAVIQYGCPRVRLLDGGRVEITACPLHIGARLRPRMEAATPRGFLRQLKESLMPGRSVEKEEKEVLDLADLSREQDLRIVKATARLSIEGGELMAKIEDIDMDVSLDWGIPGDVIDKVSAWIMEQVAERFPPIRVRLPLESVMIPVLGVSPIIRLDGLGGQEGHLDVHADIDFAEVPSPVSPLPRFLADSQLRLVHREDCPSAHLVPENAKIGYFSLHDAISDGYRGCPECLSLYRNIDASGDAVVGRSVGRMLKRA